MISLFGWQNRTPTAQVLLLICLGLLFEVRSALGQVEQPVRIEIEMDHDDDYFSVISAGEKGIVLYREVRNRETRMERKWQVYMLDTALNIVWENHYFIHVKYINIGWEHCGQYFYLLFQQNAESVKADWFVLRINIDDQSSETFLIERDYPLDLSEFEVVNNTMIFGGYANTRPAVVIYKFGENQPRVLPGFYTEKSNILQVETDDDVSQFDVLTTIKGSAGKRSISLKSFDEEGEMIQDVNLKPSDDRSLLYGSVVNIGSNFRMIAGTYTRKRSELSRGIFLAKIAPTGEHIINYYNYADLNNFFSYMKAKREKRIEERIQRRKIKGKKNKFSYRLIVHDIVERDDSYIMVGEAFYPKYTQHSYDLTFYMPSTSRSNYGRFFNGYQYTHAVVIGFDTSGRLIWDNSFEIRDIKSWELEQYVQVSAQEESIVLLYLYENVIRSKIIKGNEVLEGKAFNDLELTFEDDIIDNEQDEYGGLKAWYEGKMFAYGVHEIKNLKTEGVKLNRDVFFINKISYQE
jgi:hypothetical protein